MVKKGFTLLELLIVISIIGILVTVAAASYSSSQKKARNSRRMSDLKSIQNAAEQYYADHDGAYPDDEDFGAEYLPTDWPNDPKSTYLYEYTPLPVPPPTTSYTVCAQMEGANGNATSATGADYPTTGGTYYCVKNLQ